VVLGHDGTILRPILKTTVFLTITNPTHKHFDSHGMLIHTCSYPIRQSTLNPIIQKIITISTKIVQRWGLNINRALHHWQLLYQTEYKFRPWPNCLSSRHFGILRANILHQLSHLSTSATPYSLMNSEQILQCPHPSVLQFMCHKLLKWRAKPSVT